MNRYNRAHRWGKLVAWSISTIILNSLLNDITWYEHVLWSGFNLLYWYGTNTFAYLYETAHNWTHKHTKL